MYTKFPSRFRKRLDRNVNVSRIPARVNEKYLRSGSLLVLVSIGSLPGRLTGALVNLANNRLCRYFFDSHVPD